MYGTNLDQLLQNTLTDFLRTHCNFNRPLLLALSGGPDSLALLFLLCRIQSHIPLHFAIAHVDHGWRIESQEEAAQLQLLAKELNLSFHLRRLDPRSLTGNLEAASRLERLKFFRELSEQEGYQAVLLGHHADDQAETVLKRVLEGNTSYRLGGLQAVTEVEGVLLWRPFLSFSKEMIGLWLKNQNGTPFVDRTNLDPRFLRGRFRTEIMPLLAEKFGKEIAKGLCCLGQESQELVAFLEETLDPYISKIEKGPLGEYLDLSDKMPQSPFALKYLVKTLCQKEQESLPRALVEDAIRMLQNNQANKRLFWGDHLLYVDRRRLFFLKTAISIALPSRQPLQTGCTRYGMWLIEVACLEEQEHAKQYTGWKQLWKGYLEYILPVDDYEIGPPILTMAYPGEHASLSKWWSNEKVPAWLRNQTPVIWKEGRIYRELLTERSGQTVARGDCLHVRMSFDG